MGFPVRQAGRHHLAIQKKSSRMAEKERIPEDLTEEFNADGTSNFSLLTVFRTLCLDEDILIIMRIV
jgi:hypothetical protein